MILEKIIFFSSSEIWSIRKKHYFCTTINEWGVKQVSLIISNYYKSLLPRGEILMNSHIYSSSWRFRGLTQKKI
jgi:hypothetical protein